MYVIQHQVKLNAISNEGSDVTIIVTGGAGFIGSAYVALSVARGEHVVVIDALTYAGNRANLEWIKASPGSWELIVGDICDRALMDAAFKKYAPKAIVHFAAESHVDQSIAAPAAFMQTNIIGTYQLLEAARAYWAVLDRPAREAFRFVYISTDEVYGELGATGAFTEQSQIAPNSPYSASKAAGDHLAHAWFHTYHMPVITTHCSNNFGPRQYPEKLIPVVINRAISGYPIPVYGTGMNVRDWIYVDDHCNGIQLALEKANPGGVYNFGGRCELSNLDLVKKICSMLDQMRPRADKKSYQEQISFVTDRPGHDWRYAIDDAYAYEALGFRPKWKFEEALKHTIEWYLQHPATQQKKAAI